MQTERFQNFTRSADIRHGLPAFAYTSESFHEAENQCLFASSWAFVGFAHEMPASGDVVPITVAGKPVLLVRDGNDKIAAFHNICRHRCLQLVDQPGNAGRMIRCPYHSWVYDLQGKLRSTPLFGGADCQTPAGFDPQENGLISIPCEVWHDWIFVNLDGGAVPFEQFIHPLAERLAHLDWTLLKPVTMLDFGVINTNWKFLLENFIEPYHVQFVHSTTTEQPLTDHEVFIDQHCLGCTVDISGTQTQSDNADTLAVDSNYLTSFPNFVVATYAPDQLGVHLNVPINAAQTSQRRVIYLLRDSDVAKKEIDALRTLWWKVHQEDHAICERLQRGRVSSVANDGGWLSPKWETGVRRFQEMVYDAVKEHANMNQIEDIT